MAISFVMRTSARLGAIGWLALTLATAACGSDSETGTKASGGSAGTGGHAASGGTSAGGSGGKIQGDGGGVGGTGGSKSDGGDAGGSSAVSRPAYNTGTGFFVANGKLYDPKGVEFRVHGVNKLHWDSESPGIPKTHANTERWVIDFNQPTSTNIALIQKTIDNHIVPMPGNWEGTCDESGDTLSKIVDEWVAQVSAWKPLEPYMILNIANEWGPEGTGWRDAYIAAVAKLRSAGYLCTISITSGGCGQSNADLVSYASAVFDSDPQKNIIFDQHIYGVWVNGSGESWQTDLATGLDKLVATGLPVIVGEFGPGRNIGPSPTEMTPSQIMQACEQRNIGWMAWAWDDPAYDADDNWFALSLNGDYNSSSDLTLYGKEVVESPGYGLLAVGKPQTSF